MFGELEKPAICGLSFTLETQKCDRGRGTRLTELMALVLSCHFIESRPGDDCWIIFVLRNFAILQYLAYRRSCRK